jgi:hypothetical protein
VHAQLADPCAALLQRPDEVAIELDGIQAARRLQQVQRDRAFARADLDEAVRRLRRHGGNDAADDRRVVEEVLAEALAGLVRHGDVSWLRGMAQ